MSYRLAVLVALACFSCGGKIDPSATERTATRRVGTVAGSSGETSSGSTSSSSSSGWVGPCNVTGLVPFVDDFEDGTISDGFRVNSPSAFSIEWDEPIDGSASLRVNPNTASYLARKVNGACSVHLGFTLKASEEFLKGGGSVARIDAASRRFSMSVLPGGWLSVYEESDDGAEGKPTKGPSIISPDAPAVVTIDVDLVHSRLYLRVLFANGNAADQSRPMDALAPSSRPPAITSVELGSNPTLSSNPTGLYWIDDISID